MCSSISEFGKLLQRGISSKINALMGNSVVPVDSARTVSSQSTLFAKYPFLS